MPLRSSGILLPSRCIRNAARSDADTVSFTVQHAEEVLTQCRLLVRLRKC